MKYAHYIYRVTFDGPTEAGLGYGDEIIDDAAYYRTKKEAEAAISESVQAWKDNPPGFFDEEERDEYYAQDFRRDYDLERLPLIVALDNLGQDAEELAELIGPHYPEGRLVPDGIASAYRGERADRLSRASASLKGASSATYTLAILSESERGQDDADRYPCFDDE